MIEPNPESTPEITPEQLSTNQRIKQIAWIAIFGIVVFVLGLGIGYLQWGRDETAKAKQEKDAATLYEQLSPKDGYNLSVPYGDLGPQLIKSAVIDYDAFAAIYKNAGNPPTPEEVDTLQKGSKQEIIINAENAHFLLNFFWAVG